jgi:DNA (cytosine-5)-methyltransferase 1
MNHLDLFSGIGGFALAAKWAGINTVAFCEIEPFAQKVLKKNFPSVPVFPDIYKLKRSNINETVDIITGGFPCQPFSIAGKKRGTDDDRDLWPEMYRIIKEFKPTWVIGENVANFVGMAFERTKTDLESEGYEVQPLIIPACGLNAPHKRDRVWILAYSDSNRRAKGNRENSGVDETGENTYREGKADTNNIRRSSEDVAYTKIIHAQRLDDRSGEGKPWGSSWWETEPRLDRVAHGVPNRVDRLKGIGNAIVPQVAYQIMKGIKK